MEFCSDFNEEMANGGVYNVPFGKKIKRIAKIFSYTFWRTKIESDIFWSVQGNNTDGSAWIATQYFGPPEEAKRYQQEITLRHPTEKRIKIIYISTCIEGMNCIKISREIVRNFKNKNNSFQFEYRLIKMKRWPYPQRML